MKKTLAFIFLFNCLYSYSQKVITKTFNFPNELDENSGLLYFDGKIIAHNDSGDKPNLYEIDAHSGEILRTIKISNAFNIDWEDIAQDNEYIYVADSGNNRGNRTNLRIYKVSKKDYLESNNVSAEIINYVYSDQKDFRYSSKNNFDAEALISYQDYLLIFSKNRGDQKSKIYKLSKEPITQTAELVNTLDVNGQITGAAYNKRNNDVALCGYSSSLSPFLIFLNNFLPENKTFFKLELFSSVGAVSQIEGVTFEDDSKVILSRERFRKKIAGFAINIKPSIFIFDKKTLTISLQAKNLDSYIETSLKTTPELSIIKITDKLGQTVLDKTDSIDISDIQKLDKGTFYAMIKLNDSITINKKIIRE